MDTTTTRPQSISNPAQTLINPYTLSNKLPNGTSSHSTPSAPSAPSALSAPKSSKPPPPSSPIAPRLDLQVFYDALKSSLSKEQWLIYTSSLNRFLSGKLNDEELVVAIGPFVKKEKVRMHNQLMSALLGNMLRDGPGVDMAGWVSASDKPSSGAKGQAGDVNERRLKREVMAISARERRRIKEVYDKNTKIEDMLGNMLQEYHIAKQVKTLDHQAPRSASLNKTNWESEIKQRYTLPLSSETGEFPDPDGFRARMQPICFEEGVPGGCSAETALFMSVAAEIFVKEVLTNIITRVRSNGSKYVQTDAYRKLAPRGRWIFAGEKPLLGMHDVRLSLTLGDNLLTQLPLSMKKIMAGGWFERDYEVDVDELTWEDEDLVTGWEGAGYEERDELRRLLDDCLAGA